MGKESLFTAEEYMKVESIIEKMQCNPKPTVLEFLFTIRNALDRNMIPRKLCHHR